MPIKATIDHVDTIDCEEVDGAITSVTRLARITGLVTGDYTVLWAALTTIGVPVFGQILDTAAIPGVPYTDTKGNSPFSGLVLVRRHVKMVDKDLGTWDVTLKYEHLLAGPNQSVFGGNRNGLIYSKGKCSVREKETNFYYPFGIRSGPTPNGFPSAKTRLVAAHQYPLSPQEYGELSGQYKEQLGTVKVPFPEKNVQFHGVLSVADPLAYARNLIATINAKIWMGEPELTWLCSEVTWQVLRPDTQLYQFGYEFQNNPDTWDPDIVFLDSRTNLPPATVGFGNVADDFGVFSLQVNPLPGLDVIPAGAWTVPFLRRLDYNDAFAAFFEGDGVVFN